MAKIQAFKALRPNKDIVKDFAVLPYDVVERKDIEKYAGKNSFFSVTRSEINFPESTDPYSDEVYSKAKEELERMEKEGILIEEEAKSLYIYEEIQEGRVQTGIVAGVSVKEYLDNIIKKHELTLKAKQKDRTMHFKACEAYTEPVFLTYRHSDSIDARIDALRKEEPVYDFVFENGVRQKLWVVSNKEDVDFLVKEFGKIDYLYIADGHHRTASAADNAIEYGKSHNIPVENIYNMAVIVPDNQINILAYNRVIRDLNGMSFDEILSRLEKDFVIRCSSDKCPELNKHEFGLYNSGKWTVIKAKDEILENKSIVELIDTDIIQKRFIGSILGIEDPRTDSRIDFIGGLDAIKEMEDCVDRGDFELAIAACPVSVKEVMDIADNNLIMPPKSTWVEPKLVSGLFIMKMKEGINDDNN